MKKKKYSLTAKERKELNGKGKINPEPTVVVDEQETTMPLEDGAATLKNRKKPLTIIVAISMIVLFLTAIVVTILLVDEMSKPNGNPTATINLSNGTKLNFELYLDDAPIAVTNFMFLSLQGFYNNTIIHDNQNNWVRFMGVRTANEDFPDEYDIKNHIGFSKGENSAFYNSFTGFDSWKTSKALDRNVFWYRLKNDTSAIKFEQQANNEGLLCFMYNYSSCLVQISCVDNPQMSIGSSDYKSFSVMGKYADNDTLAAIRQLNQMESTQNGVWRNPNEIVKITSVKIRNYDKNQWNGKDGILQNFDTYMEEIGGYDSYASETYNYNRIRTI